MNCIRSIRYLHSSSLSLARQRPLKASLPSHINPESVADDILDSLFLETTRSSQPIKREPLIVEDVESYSSLNEITVTRGRSNRRIRPVKIEPPSISSRLAPLNSPKQPPKEEETIQEEKTWEQDLDAYVPPPTSTEKDMSWFVGHVENFKKTTPEFIPRWKKRADDFEEAITTPSRPEISLEKLEFSPETLRDGLIATLEGERASDIVVLDVTGKTDMARFMIIATGRSKRQIYGLVDACKRFARKFINLGEFMQPEFLSIEGEDSDDWMLLDTGSVVVHCFTQEGRDEYDLEGLWTNIDKFIEEIEAETEEEELVRLEAEKMTVKPLK